MLMRVLSWMVMQCFDLQSEGYIHVMSKAFCDVNQYAMLNICKLTQWCTVVPVCLEAPCSQAQDSVETPSCPP